MFSFTLQIELAKCEMFTRKEYVEEGEVRSMESSSALWSNRQVGNAGSLSTREAARD